MIHENLFELPEDCTATATVLMTITSGQTACEGQQAYPPGHASGSTRALEDGPPGTPQRRCPRGNTAASCAVQAEAHEVQVSPYAAATRASSGRDLPPLVALLRRASFPRPARALAIWLAG
jgi:hypothetical protein